MSGAPLGWGSALLALSVAILWGGNVASLKLGLATVPPLWSAFWRMLLGAATLAAWARWQGIALRISRREARALTILSLLFTAQIALLNIGTVYSSPGYAVVLINANPVFTNLIGHFMPFEPRLNRIRSAGLLLAFGGVGWITLGRPDIRLAPDPLFGNLLLCVSSALLGIRLLYTRHLVQGIEPTRAVTWQVLLSVPLFLLMAAGTEPPTLRAVTWAPVAALAYQGVIVAGYCFVVWTSLLRKHSAGTLSAFSFTIPFFGIVASAVMFGERVTLGLLGGAVVVTLGILLMLRGEALARGDSR